MGSEINSLHSFLSRGICYELLMLRYVGLGLGLLTRGLQSHRDLLLENLALRARRSLTSRFLPQPIATQQQQPGEDCCICHGGGDHGPAHILTDLLLLAAQLAGHRCQPRVCEVRI